MLGRGNKPAPGEVRSCHDNHPADILLIYQAKEETTGRRRAVVLSRPKINFMFHSRLENSQARHSGGGVWGWGGVGGDARVLKRH